MSAGQVGEVRKRLARAIVKAMASQGLEAKCDPAALRPNQGAWRTDIRLDCSTWAGHFEIFREGKWLPQGVLSFDRMTSCVKGFKIERSSDGWGQWEVYALIDIAPKDRFKASAKRMSGM